jgi:hypothetical protein
MFGLGRAQRGTRRALIANYPNPVRVADLLAWVYPRISKPTTWHRVAVHRAVKRWAIVVGKTGNGYGNLWVANAELERQIRCGRASLFECRRAGSFSGLRLSFC